MMELLFPQKDTDSDVTARKQPSCSGHCNTQLINLFIKEASHAALVSARVEQMCSWCGICHLYTIPEVKCQTREDAMASLVQPNQHMTAAKLAQKQNKNEIMK